MQSDNNTLCLGASLVLLAHASTRILCDSLNIKRFHQNSFDLLVFAFDLFVFALDLLRNLCHLTQTRCVCVPALALGSRRYEDSVRFFENQQISSEFIGFACICIGFAWIRLYLRWICLGICAI